MIASGLCAMGGCFAMENGEAVAAYWPAEKAIFSSETSSVFATLLMLPVRGGDSENEYFSGRFVALHNSSIPDYSIVAGVNHIEGIGRCNVNVAHQDSSLWGNYGQNGNALVMFQEVPIEVTLHTAPNKCYFYKNGEFAFVKDSIYTIEDSQERGFYLRSMLVREFAWFYYSNARNGRKFTVRGMKSPDGVYALYTDYESILVEV